MEHRKALVASFYESEGNLFAAMAQDIEWRETPGMPYGGVYRGSAAIRERVFRKLDTDWAGFEAHVEEVHAVGTCKILSLGRYRGVSRTTGKALIADFAHVYTFEDDKIVLFQQFGDSAAFCRALS